MLKLAYLEKNHQEKTQQTTSAVEKGESLAPRCLIQSLGHGKKHKFKVKALGQSVSLN